MKNWIPGLLVFFIFLLAGLKEGPGYGISWDEGDQHYLGDLTLRYATDRNDKELAGSMNKEYGAAFEWPLAYMKKKLNLSDPRDIYIFRHQATHITFVLSALAIFGLALGLSGSSTIGVITMLLYLLSPHIYAHSFYNTKDIPFLCFLAITLYVAFVAFKKDKLPWYLLLGATAGYTTGIRVMGIMVATFICLMLITDIILDIRNRQRIVKRIINWLGFVLTFCAALYVSWPYLWDNPADKFIGAYRTMSHYQWEGNILTGGAMLFSTKLPWWYIPRWFSVTTPIFWMVAGAAGILLLLADLVFHFKRYIRNGNERNFLLYFLCLACPVAAVIMLHAIVYDDWRHLYFVYGPFSLMALYFFIRTWKTKFRYAVLVLFGLQLGLVSYYLVKNVRYGNVYFNELVSHKPGAIRQRYEMDYWGLSFREGLEYIASHDTATIIRVAGNARWPVILNALIVNPANKKTFLYTSLKDADYFLTNYRTHPGGYEHEIPPAKEIFNIEKENSIIFSVFKMDRPKKTDTTNAQQK